MDPTTNPTGASFPGIYIEKKKKKRSNSDPEKESQGSDRSRSLSPLDNSSESCLDAFGCRHHLGSPTSPTWTDITDEGGISNEHSSSDTNSPAADRDLPTQLMYGECDMDDKNQLAKPKRAKRKKKKAPRGVETPDDDEENPAVDPIRYKTKMCRNWEQFEKCPYGPRCLFAHGKRDLRSYAANHTAINTAASTGSPERQFYSVGHFPSFVPVPWELMYDRDGNQQPQPQLPPPTSQHGHTHGQPPAINAYTNCNPTPHALAPEHGHPHTHTTSQQQPSTYMTLQETTYHTHHHHHPATATSHPGFQFPSMLFNDSPSAQPSLTCSII